MEFEISMSDFFESKILTLLNNVKLESKNCAGCKLVKADCSKHWVIECNWLDKASMHDHLLSSELQELRGFLILNSSRIKFEICSPAT
jgi:uncharacterized Fe-S center protein